MAYIGNKPTDKIITENDIADEVITSPKMNASDATNIRIKIGAISANEQNTFTKPQKTDTLALTHNTAWDGTDKQHLTVNVNGSSFTIANPSTHINGTYYIVYVTYTTAHSIAFGTTFKGVSDIVPTASAGAVDHFVFRSNGTNLMLVGAASNVGV